MEQLERIIASYKENPKRIVRTVGTLSGQVYLTELNGRKYKIRDCNPDSSEMTVYRRYKQSKSYQGTDPIIISLWLKYVQEQVEDCVPKFFGIKDNILVMEWINGRELKLEEPEKNIEKIGYLVGKIHQLPLPCWAFKPDFNFFQKNFRENLDRILSDFPKLNSLLDIYQLVKPDKLELGCIYGSLLTHNLMITEDNEVKLVDEENWKVDLPLGELVIPMTYWFSKGQKKAFFDGYEKAGGDISDFDKQEKFTSLYHLVKWLNRRLFFGRKDNPEILDQLQNLEQEVIMQKCLAA